MAENKRSIPNWIYFVAPLVLVLIAAGLLFVFRDSLPFELPLPVALQATATQTNTLEPTRSPTPPLAMATASLTATPTLTVTQMTVTNTATITSTATKKLTATPIPNSTNTPTPEGLVDTPTPTRTQRWYYRVNTNTPRPSYTPTFTKTPTITLTPTPRDHELRIDSPGPLSKIVSPLLYDAYIAPGVDGKAYVQLIGEDGRVIATDTIYGDYGRHYRVQRYLEFIIPGAGELARLQISVLDGHGRITALSSVDMVLLQMGTDVTNPAIHWLDPYIIWHPEDESTVSGGVAWIDGLAYNISEMPVILEMIASDGTVIAHKEIILPEVKEGRTHARFDVGMPYTVEEETPVLLVMYQESDNRLGGVVYLSSVEIVLKP